MFAYGIHNLLISRHFHLYFGYKCFIACSNLLLLSPKSC
jgi:hypothetical protein